MYKLGGLMKTKYTMTEDLTIRHDPKMRALFLKAHLRLQIVGMRHSKLSRRDILQRCVGITGKSYVNTIDGCKAALEDLQQIINTEN